MTFQCLGDSLLKDPTTISKEIKLHRKLIAPKNFNNGYNQCANKYTCTKRGICNDNCRFFCKECVYCHRYCKDFKKMICPSLTKPPYVCNECSSFSTCRFEKYIYSAEDAHKEYLFTQSDSKQGINMSSKELLEYEQTLIEGLKKGQSFENIVYSNPDKIPYSVRSVYKHLEKYEFLNIKNIDLRQKVKIKLRQKKKSQKEVQLIRKAKAGHTYNDFKKFIEKYPHLPIVEMDTVIGKRDDGECLLTFMIRSCSILLIVKLEEHTSKAVVEAINNIYNALGKKVFKTTFPVILTDNGSEFDDIYNMEFSKDGTRRCRIFFCEPMRSDQKGKLENAHRLIRYVLPKGTSFNGLTQKDVTKIYNNINSYIRKELNHNSPITLGKLLLRNEVIKYFELDEIPAKDVNLTPKLLSNK